MCDIDIEIDTGIDIDIEIDIDTNFWGAPTQFILGALEEQIRSLEIQHKRVCYKTNIITRHYFLLACATRRVDASRRAICGALRPSSFTEP